MTKDHWTNERILEATKDLWNGPPLGAMAVDFASALNALRQRNAEIELFEAKIALARKALQIALTGEKTPVRDREPILMALRTALDATR